MRVEKKNFASGVLLFILVLNMGFLIAGVEINTETQQNQTNPKASPYANIGAWIIVAGDRSDHDKLNYIIYGCDMVHQILNSLGFSSDDIYYLAPEVDGYDQSIYNDDVTNLANIDYAIGTWAAGKVDANKSLGMYLFDHGGVDGMCIPGADLSATHLDSELDDLETATGCNRIICVYEACHSGSFIDNLSQDNRIIITATHQVHGSSVNPAHTWATFSEGFWSSVSKCNSIGEAFEDAREFVVASGHGTSQFPWIDDNHDTIPHETDSSGNLPNGGDGDDALNTVIGDWISCMPPFRLYLPRWQYVNIWEFPYEIPLFIEPEVTLSDLYIKFIPPNFKPEDLLAQQDEIQGEEGMHTLIQDNLPTIHEVMDDGEHDGLVWDDGEHGDGIITINVNRLDQRFEIPMRDEGEYQVCAYFMNDKGIISNVARSRITFLDAGVTAPADRIPPTVSILDPSNNTAIDGKHLIKVQANDNLALDRVQIFVDGALMHDEMMVSAPYPNVYYYLDTTTMANGPCNITAVAYDHIGLKVVTTHEVEIKNEDADKPDDDDSDDTSGDIDIPGYPNEILMFLTSIGVVYAIFTTKKSKH